MIHLPGDLTALYTKKYVWIWLLSAFKAGFINSAGFLATGTFVSHVTGFSTQMGMSAGHPDLLFGAELLVIPIAFIGGGVLTSLVLDRNYQSNETPPYHWIQGLVTFLIGVVILLGEIGIVHKVGHYEDQPVHQYSELIVITLLCLICGLKNALVTWTTKGKIRVTHLTGLATDIGLHFVRMFNKHQPSPQWREDRQVNLIRILTFLSFSTGAVSSAIIFPKVGYKCFFVVLVISLFMTGLAIYDRRLQRKHVEVDEPVFEPATQN